MAGGQSPFGDKPVAAAPSASPFGDKPTVSSGAVAPTTEMPPAPANVPGPRGYLTDPAEDEKAFKEALQQRELTGQSAFGDTLDELTQGATFGLTRPLAGAISAISGDGYEYGKAVDKYRQDLRRENLGSAGGPISFIGGMLSPGSAAKSVGKIALESAVGSAVQGRAESVQGEERTIADDLATAGIGAGIGAGVGKLGQIAKPASEIDTIGSGQKPEEILAATRQGLGIGAPGKETSGMNLRDAIVSDQDRLYRSGQKQIADSLAGDAMIGGKSFVPIKKEVDFAYPEIREAQGKAPIMISSKATPAAFQIKKMFNAIPGDKPLSLSGYDAWRRQAKEVVKNAANPTDKAAAIDFLEAVDVSVGNAFKSNKTSGGDPALYDAYVAGRDAVGLALKAKGHKKIAELIDDQSIPGSVIADELLNIGTKAGKKNAASAAARIRDTLGEDSASMQSLRNGVLDLMLSGDGSETSVKKLVSTIEDNREMLGEIFTPEQLDALNKLPVELTNATAAGAKSSPVVASLFSKLLNDERAGKAIAEFMSKNKAPLGAMAAGMPSGVPTAAAAWLGAKAIAKATSYRPVRSGISLAIDATGKPLTREIATTMGPYAGDDITDRINIATKTDEELMREYQQQQLMGGN
jgi:hypothetical protein